jgi:hypothetical protein
MSCHTSGLPYVARTRLHMSTSLRFVFLLLLLCLLTLPGCKKHEAVQFLLTQEDVLADESTKRGIIYAKDGADGPYAAGSTTQGNVNTAGFILAGHGKGQTKLAWPATKGYFYEGTAYLNEADGAYIVLRKVPVTEGDKAEEK